MTTDTLAFVGAAGGVGTTRLTLESATLLARNGRDVAVLDAAYATQGLADLTPGRIDPDMTALCLDDAPLETGLQDRRLEGAGRLAVCPARAPFERLARAKTPEAAESFEDRIAEGVRAFDHVLLDVPPVAANQAVAATTAADAVAVVADAARASDAIPRAHDRLLDLGVETTAAVVTHTDGHPEADATVPTLESEPPAVTDDTAARKEVGGVLAATMDLSVDPDAGDGLRGKLSL
ncbi:ParA family protein [Natronomonas marina]|uniref:ParA family protein n=1 Tax=Natronomonas marina TaxID=2961939 RepID=UPI0020C95743|nr:ParA family protein [Natronomonas marina]